MAYTSNLKTWSVAGTEYPDSYSYEAGVQPVDEWDNFLVDNIIKDIQHLVSQSNDYDTHKADASAHHTRYADTEAVSAVNAETSLTVDISGDADTVDGNHAGAFADSGHLHDGRYVLESGDAMSGNLDLGNNAINNANSITLARNGIQSSSTWLEIDGNGDGLLFNYKNQTDEARFYGPVDIRSGISMTSSDWSDYELQKNGSDTTGVINFKT